MMNEPQKSHDLSLGNVSQDIPMTTSPQDQPSVYLVETFYITSKKNTVFQVRLTEKGLSLRKKSNGSSKEQTILLEDIIGCRCLRSKRKRNASCACSSVPGNESKLRVVEDSSVDLDETDVSAYLYIYAYILKKNRRGGHRERTTLTLRFRSFDKYEDNNKEAQKWRAAIKKLLADKMSVNPHGYVVKDMRKVLILVNPKSGSGKARETFQQRVAPIFVEAEIPYELHVTKHANYARDFVRNKDIHIYKYIVVVGGDGLYFEVINGMFERVDWERAIAEICIGIIPCGSGNGLARSIAHSYKSNWEESVTKNSTNITPSDVDESRLHYIITYAILMAVATYVYVHRTFAFFFMCLRASMQLHDKLFRGVTRAGMFFFNNNPSGRILNRFSRDISNIDTMLPPSLIDCISFFFQFLATMVIVAIANYWLVIPTLVMTIFFYILRYVYISTARSIKRVESLTLSPIYSHINGTLQGLPTVRAFNAQHILESEFYIHSDYNTGASYLKLTTNRAFAFWLDVVCVVYIGVVTFSFVVIDNRSSRSGNIGLAILNCINLIGMCQWGMRQTAEIESQMTSVERIVEYADLQSEAALESEPKHQPPQNWPCNGEIVFNDLNFKYSENSDFVLRNLNLRIQPREKIGIVGRTGAGKSSIVQAVFRLAELNGEIIIDGIVTNTLGLHDLRKKISIIPQDPVVFSGTLRFNLDPFGEHSDEKIWDALEQVELKSFVSSSLNGLDCKMMDGGSNFSMGQRQLVCLARALLRNNKILICDEATANVDPETDKLIQKTIREKFSDCSVLTIAHRLHTVMDNDRILVIDAGNVVEFGHPYELLQQSDGHFRRLVDQTGAAESDKLMRIAAENLSTE